MSYDTSFDGHFDLTPPLTPSQTCYLQKFCETRHMRRNPAVVETLPDPLRVSVSLPIGDEGGYFVNDLSSRGDDSVVDPNRPPKGQPSLWCQWTVSDDGYQLFWDEGEGFCEYEQWLRYLIDHFLRPWGVTINGQVEWTGEDQGDTGLLIAEDNEIRVAPVLTLGPTSPTSHKELVDALSLVVDLAWGNVIDERELPEEHARQSKALGLVQEHLDLLRDQLDDA